MINIGMAFQKDADRSTLSPSDFAPLVTPTSSLLTRIARGGGPEIPPADLVGAVVPFTLLRIDQSTTLYARMLFESSNEPAHARLLQSQRIAELQSLFARFSAATPEDVQTLKDRPASAHAATLVSEILEGAKAYANGGSSSIRIGTTSVVFMKLK